MLNFLNYQTILNLETDKYLINEHLFLDFIIIIKVTNSNRYIEIIILAIPNLKLQTYNLVASKRNVFQR